MRLTSAGTDVSFHGDLERNGFAIVDELLDSEAVFQLQKEIAEIQFGDATRSKQGEVYAVRDALRLLPSARDLAKSEALLSWITSILGMDAQVARNLLFDKTPSANWKVPWHQDLTIAVQRKVDLNGYGPWSAKAGVPHVQPPLAVLELMLAVRLHLDDTDEANGALKVFSGSHRHGRLSPEAIQRWKEAHHPIVCRVPRGGAMFMRPLLLHASSPMQTATHRRVLHLEYAAGSLPGGLEWRET